MNANPRVAVSEVQIECPIDGHLCDVRPVGWIAECDNCRFQINLHILEECRSAVADLATEEGALDGG
jgi:hypothetical protein